MRRHRRRRGAARRRRPRGDSGLRRAERQRSRRPVRLPADADHLDARRRARRAGRGRALRAAHPLSPEDRHRHEPPRVPVRQPAAHAAGAPGERAPRARRGLHALRDRRRSGHRRCSTSSARASSARSPTIDGARRDARAIATRPTAPRSLRDARVWFDRVRPGLLLYGIVPPPLASTIELDAGR